MCRAYRPCIIKLPYIFFLPFPTQFIQCGNRLFAYKQWNIIVFLKCNNHSFAMQEIVRYFVPLPFPLRKSMTIHSFYLDVEELLNPILHFSFSRFRVYIESILVLSQQTNTFLSKYLIFQFIRKNLTLLAYQIGLFKIFNFFEPILIIYFIFKILYSFHNKLQGKI